VQKTVQSGVVFSVFLSRYHLDYQIVKKKMGGAWEKGEVHTEF